MMQTTPPRERGNWRPQRSELLSASARSRATSSSGTDQPAERSENGAQ